MAIESRWTEGTGGKLHYLDNAPDEPVGLPILFAPGVTDMADEYVEVMEFLLPRRTVVVDVRGRGRSDSPPAGYALVDLADDLDTVAQDAGLERVHVMTFSRGTPTALTYSFRHPDLVASVIIGDYFVAEIRLEPPFVEHMWGSRFRGKPMPERVERHVLEGIQQTSKAEELWPKLAALDVPVLVGRGTGDGVIVRNELVERYKAEIPGVEVVDIPGAPHDLFRPDRLAFPRHIVDFLSRRCPGE
jgi:non-heme chloroperoxidase